MDVCACAPINRCPLYARCPVSKSRRGLLLPLPVGELEEEEEEVYPQLTDQLTIHLVRAWQGAASVPDSLAPSREFGGIFVHWFSNTRQPVLAIENYWGIFRRNYNVRRLAEEHISMQFSHSADHVYNFSCRPVLE